MAKSIYERVRAAQAAAEKARKDAEYKAGEPARRSQAARFAAQVRKDNRIDAAVEHDDISDEVLAALADYVG